ncbi:hypothetical protein Patl1_26377 [Pistacia atlantica]|uniref:Uncharacterized protein n=1 Tax=Pistacia atlantica TaxID=434234 RepID=A0ACC1B481_9ROSI|nr:hypothetical protein Patl1_26377 [Pistacia atlantica]
MVSMFAKLDMMVEANWVFQMMPQHDIVSWNALIGGYAENEPNAAVEAYKLMKEEGTPMNYIT